MTSALLLCTGMSCLAAAALAWSGRWRVWSRRVTTGPLPLPITILPGLGFGALGAGLHEAGVRSDATSLLFLPMVAGLVLYFWAPDWWGPKWLREERARGPQPDLSDPATALSFVALTSGPPAVTSVGDGGVGRVGEPLARWNATWLDDSLGTEKPHGLGRAGAMGGRLVLHADGLVFESHGVEDRLRGGGTRLGIGRDEVLRARVVAAGADADGRKRDGRGVRSVFPRLVVDTRESQFLFEVNFAKRKAARIGEALRPHARAPSS